MLLLTVMAVWYHHHHHLCPSGHGQTWKRRDTKRVCISSSVHLTVNYLPKAKDSEEKGSARCVGLHLISYQRGNACVGVAAAVVVLA